MRKLPKLTLLFSVFGFFLIFLFPKDALAASCSSITVTPTQTTPGTPFTLDLSGCDPANDTYDVEIQGSAVAYFQTYQVIVTNGTGTLLIPNDSLQPDFYSLSVYYLNEPLGTRDLAVIDSDASCSNVSVTNDENKTVHVTADNCEPLYTDVQVQVTDENGTQIHQGLVSVVNGVLDFTLPGEMFDTGREYKINVVYSTSQTLLSKTIKIVFPNAIFCDKETKTQLNTAMGCVPINQINPLILFLVTWAIGVTGGIGLVFIFLAGLQIMLSSGDPRKLKSGKDLLFSAISGILLILFSIYLLRVIGIDILKLPGL